MAVTKCPYEPTILDEASGTEVTNEKYTIWCEGAFAGYNQRSKELELAMQKCNVVMNWHWRWMQRLIKPVKNNN